MLPETGSCSAVFGFGSVWITTTGPKGARGAGSVQRIDPQTNKVVVTISIGPTPRFLAAGEGAVWTLNQGDGTVSRIDPATNRLAATIAAAVPGGGGDIAAGAGRVWVRASKILLQAIDPKRNVVVDRFGPPAGSGAVRAVPSKEREKPRASGAWIRATFSTSSPAGVMKKPLVEPRWSYA